MPSRASGRLTRRRLFGGALAAPALLPADLYAQAPFSTNPFSLGVASGEPTSEGAVIWTRIHFLQTSTEPLLPGYQLAWEIAEDDRFARIARRGVATARADEGHSARVEIDSLAAGRDYFYRFRLGGLVSSVGRLRTLPPQDSLLTWRFAMASCQHYEQGWYGAWRDAVAQRPDAILFLGDYVYERSIRGETVRAHGAGPPTSLEEWRARYTLYKLDPDLQAAHAAAPWFAIWDDHEVENDYANDRGEHTLDPAFFLRMRAAAYRAWWENMPAPRFMRPSGPSLPLRRRVDIGALADVHFLDTRQFRSHQPCQRPGRGGGGPVGPACAERGDPAATMLGAEQERWLAEGLKTQSAQWTLIAQTTQVSAFDYGREQPQWRSDAWDGYPAARDRLLASIENARAPNPVLLGGDIHAHALADLRRDGAPAGSTALASEIVTTGISSPGANRPEAADRALLARNPHMKFLDSRHRGSTICTLSRDRLEIDLRGVEDARDPRTGGRSLAKFVVEAGRPGLQRA